MTIYPGFDVLECKGQWTPGHDERSMDVIVQLGLETITIRSVDEAVLTHWSLYFIQEVDDYGDIVVFSPNPETGEWLELDDKLMIGALRGEIIVERQSPIPNRFSLGISWWLIGLIALLAGTGAFYGSDRLIEIAASLVAASNRATIGESVYSAIDVNGAGRCDADDGMKILLGLQNALLHGERVDTRVLRDIPFMSRSLPGGIIILNAELLNRHDGPEVIAGYMLMESERLGAMDPLIPFLQVTGPMRLVTIGLGRQIGDSHYESFGDHLIDDPIVPVDYNSLLSRIDAAGFPAHHFVNVHAFIDERITAFLPASTLDSNPYRPLLTDSDWQLLRNICIE